MLAGSLSLQSLKTHILFCWEWLGDKILVAHSIQINARKSKQDVSYVDSSDRLKLKFRIHLTGQSTD